MTFTGLKFTDYFLACLIVKNKSGKPIISERNADILKSYFDFENNCTLTYSEVANLYGLTRERIRQIVAKSVSRIGFAVRRPDASLELYRLKYVLKTIEESSGNSVDLKIYHFWEEHLNEYSYSRICFLVYLLMNPGKRVKPEFKELIANYRRKESLEKIARFRRTRRKNYTQQIISIKQNSLLKKVIWFDKVRKWNNIQKEKYLPKRTIGKKEKILSGVFESTKCNRVIQYESGVELAFIKQLKRFPEVEWYIEQPTTICFPYKGREIRYTPDFAVMLKTKEIFLVEVKQRFNMLDARVIRKLDKMTEYCKEHGFGLILTDGKNTIKDLYNRNYNPNLEEKILEKLAERRGRIIFFKEIMDVLQSYNSGLIDLLPIVLRNNLTLYPLPFRLTNRKFESAFLESILGT